MTNTDNFFNNNEKLRLNNKVLVSQSVVDGIGLRGWAVHRRKTVDGGLINNKQTVRE